MQIARYLIVPGLLLAVGVLAGAKPSPEPAPRAGPSTAAQELAAIEKLGATVTTETNAQGKRLLAIKWASDTATDAALEHFELLKNLPNLGSVSLILLKMTDAGAAHVKPFTQLQSLDLSGGKFTDEALKMIKDMKELRSLELNSDKKISDEGLINIETLTHLLRLNIYSSNMTNKSLAHLQHLTELQELGIGLNNITDDGLDNLANLVNLTALGINGTRVTNKGLEKLRPLVKLQRLFLAGSLVTDAGMNTLKDFTALKSLHLSGHVGDAGLAIVGQMTQLEVLDTDGSKAVTDAGLVSLEKLTRLQYLHIFNTSVTAAGVRKLQAALPKCKINWQTVGNPPEFVYR